MKDLIRWALNQEIDNPQAKLILVSIAIGCAKRGSLDYEIPYSKIAEGAKCSTRTAVRHIRLLADNGFIEIQRRKKKDNTDLANSYRLLV